MERRLGLMGPNCCAHCESYAQDIEIVVLVIRVFLVVVFVRLKNCTAALCIFP